jgi:hypothetical protein
MQSSQLRRQPCWRRWHAEFRLHCLTVRNIQLPSTIEVLESPASRLLCQECFARDSQEFRPVGDIKPVLGQGPAFPQPFPQRGRGQCHRGQLARSPGTGQTAAPEKTTWSGPTRREARGAQRSSVARAQGALQMGARGAVCAARPAAQRQRARAPARPWTSTARAGQGSAQRIGNMNALRRRSPVARVPSP